MDKKGILMVISGPSGSGKGTVVKELMKSKDFALSISATTRKPRPGEVNGREYFFKTVDEFKEMIEKGELLEWAQFVENYYGTPKEYVLNKLEEGENVILEIEVQGAGQIKNIYPEAKLIFLAPPSKDELRKRLEGRNTEDMDTINKRIKQSEAEIKLMADYDYCVINETVEKAAEEIKQIAKICKMEGHRFKDFAEKF